MTHKVRIRRWRGLKEMTSLRADSYPPEGSNAWWMTCQHIGCSVNRGTWTYGWGVALDWALKHRADPEGWTP